MSVEGLRGQNGETLMPKGIQRKRTKGWRMPENCVDVSRSSKWGNPFRVLMYGRQGAIDRFECYVLPHLPVHELRGKDLACWCPLDQPCHRDVLLKAANE